MKAQSSIEYLLTYGWMLVAVAVAGGSVYTMTGSQCIETSNSFTGSLQASDFTVDSETGELVILVENNDPDTVQISETLLTAGGEQINQSTSLKLNPGDSEAVPVSKGFKSSTECNTYPITLTYDQGGLSNIDSQGTITGGIELARSPEAPQIESVTQ